MRNERQSRRILYVYVERLRRCIGSNKKDKRHLLHNNKNNKNSQIERAAFIIYVNIFLFLVKFTVYAN